jgi:hypothetical protein
MTAAIAFFGPKATTATVVLCMLIAPVAVWHHVHLVIEVIKHIRKEWSE